MSGGSFNYTYQKTMQFADDLRTKLNEQGNPGEYYGLNNPVWEPEVSEKLYEIANLADYVGLLMKEAEWLYSGDTGDETFMGRVTEIENRINK